MYTLDQWNAVLAPAVTWQDAYAAVEEQVRLLLSRYAYQRPEGATTAEVVEALYPFGDTRGLEGLKARARIFKALAALATRGLADCATRGDPVTNKMGKTVRPWRWHAPDPNVVKSCPTCRRPL